MAITTVDGYIASAKQIIPYIKTAGRTSVATGWYTMFDIAGNPGAGTLAGTSTANGVAVDDTVTGFPPINTFGGGATGYLTTVDFSSSVASRITLTDLLWKAGAYSYAAGTTAVTATALPARRPNSSYVGLQIWIEVSTAFSTGNAWTVSCTYYNQNGSGDGTRTTPALANMAAAALTAGRMYQLPLQAGDTGVSEIKSVVVTNNTTAMTAGAFNVLIVRPLWSGRVQIANGGDTHGLDKTGMVQVYDTTALYPIFAADSTAIGVPEMQIEIANG